MKFIPIILGLYLLYYVGMVIYDLFLKKEKVIEADNNEQNFSLSEFAEQQYQEPISVGIEDVEDIRMPKSFESEENISLSANEESQMMEDLQKKYEDEKHFEKETIVDEPIEKQFSEEKPQQEISNPKPFIVDQPIKTLNLENIVNDINTRIKMVSNFDGHKVYHIQK